VGQRRQSGSLTREPAQVGRGGRHVDRGAAAPQELEPRRDAPLREGAACGERVGEELQAVPLRRAGPGQGVLEVDDLDAAPVLEERVDGAHEIAGGVAITVQPQQEWYLAPELPRLRRAPEAATRLRLQKTRDIAILRSVGFRRNDILSVFLLQGAIIATTGGAIGCVIGHYLLVALSHLKTHQEGLVKSEYFLVDDDPRVYVYGVLFAVMVGIVASLIPAVRGSKVEPVDVLRGQLG